VKHSIERPGWPEPLLFFVYFRQTHLGKGKFLGRLGDSGVRWNGVEVCGWSCVAHEKYQRIQSHKTMSGFYLFTMLPGDLASLNPEQAQEVLEHGVNLQQKSSTHNSLSIVPPVRAWVPNIKSLLSGKLSMYIGCPCELGIGPWCRVHCGARSNDGYHSRRKLLIGRLVQPFATPSVSKN
jgi:hypothetical protein